MRSALALWWGVMRDPAKHYRYVEQLNPLALIWGVSSLVGLSSSVPSVITQDYWALPMGVLLGLAMMGYYGIGLAFLLRRTHPQVGRNSLRLAMAVGLLPVLLSAVLWIPRSVLYSLAVGGTPLPIYEILGTTLWLLEIAALLWTVVLSMNTLAIAVGVSIWRALLLYALVNLPIVAILGDSLF